MILTTSLSEKMKSDNIIFSVVWWTGTWVKESTFLSFENADAFAKRMEASGLLVARGHMSELSPEKYKRLSKSCVDYEPPKKN